MTASYNDEETIAAISTPPGSGGIGIVRISGRESIGILRQVFERSSKKKELIPWHFHHGHLIVAGKTIDEVLACYMQSPHTYTREDVAEIHCHGGSENCKRVLAFCLNVGARLAQPGEFTWRAYLNGRIDLTQAEAVADIINATSEKALKEAQRQLMGALRNKIAASKADLIEILVEIERSIDFPEEEEPSIDLNVLRSRLESVLIGVEELLDSFKEGRRLREGALVVLTGKPNVGKSTLFNALLGRDRAITHDEPGTTRDFLEESLEINGVFIRLVDTAGLRDGGGEVEQEGVKRTRLLMEESDLIVHLLDSSTITVERELLLPEEEDKDHIVVLNKIDLNPRLSEEGSPRSWLDGTICAVSSLEGRGIEALKERIKSKLIQGDEGECEVMVTNLRHVEVLERCAEHLRYALAGMGAGLSEELFAQDLHNAKGALAELLGEKTPDDVLNKIFSTFCIGK